MIRFSRAEIRTVALLTNALSTLATESFSDCRIGAGRRREPLWF